MRAEYLFRGIGLLYPATRLVSSGGARLGSRWIDLCLTFRVTWNGAPMSEMI
jgi:hypothetical protein